MTTSVMSFNGLVGVRFVVLLYAPFPCRFATPDNLVWPVWVGLPPLKLILNHMTVSGIAFGSIYYPLIPFCVRIGRLVGPFPLLSLRFLSVVSYG